MKYSDDIILEIIRKQKKVSTFTLFPNLGFYEDYPDEEIEVIKRKYLEVLASSKDSGGNLEAIRMIVPNNNDRLLQCLDRYSGIECLRNTAVNGICVMDFILFKSGIYCDLSVLYEYIVENMKTARFIFINLSNVLIEEFISWGICDLDHVYIWNENLKNNIGFIKN